MFNTHSMAAGRGLQCQARLSAGSQSGVTLIELLIVVTIVGILAAVVYPSYREQVERTRRADAKAVLMQNAQLMERIFTQNGTYAPGGNDPTIISRSPVDGNRIYYNIAFAATAGANTFDIEAIPAGVANEAGKLAIDETGNRWWDRNENGAFDAGEDTWNEH